MVERFDAYYDSISCKSTGRHIHADGEFVLASDFAALEAELARVKAESLRVVADGEACSMEDVDIWRCVDNMLGLYMYEKELLLCDDGTGLATPVRLERWEDEG